MWRSRSRIAPASPWGCIGITSGSIESRSYDVHLHPLAPMLEKEFSHVPNFTGYMGIIFGIIQKEKKSQKVLDIPAGNGLLAARLRQCGHEAVCADINREKPDYVFADLNERLPFPDREFDTCVCMEGIEHVLDSAALISELCRVTAPGGRIILSLPNIQSAFSRL